MVVFKQTLGRERRDACFFRPHPRSAAALCRSALPLCFRSDSLPVMTIKKIRSSNKTLHPFENALTPSPSPKGRGEVLFKPLNDKSIARRTLIVVLAAMIVIAMFGAAAGVAVLHSYSSDTIAIRLGNILRTGPKAVVDRQDWDLGIIESPEEFAHAFIIRNEGDLPLKLSRGPSTCSCTVGNLPVGLECHFNHCMVPYYNVMCYAHSASSKTENQVSLTSAR